MINEKQFCQKCLETWKQVSVEKDHFECRVRQAEVKAQSTILEMNLLRSQNKLMKKRMAFLESHLNESYDKEIILQGEVSLLHQKLAGLLEQIKDFDDNNPQSDIKKLVYGWRMNQFK